MGVVNQMKKVVQDLAAMCFVFTDNSKKIRMEIVGETRESVQILDFEACILSLDNNRENKSSVQTTMIRI